MGTRPSAAWHLQSAHNTECRSGVRSTASRRRSLAHQMPQVLCNNVTKRVPAAPLGSFTLFLMTWQCTQPCPLIRPADPMRPNKHLLCKKKNVLQVRSTGVAGVPTRGSMPSKTICLFSQSTRVQFWKKQTINNPRTHACDGAHGFQRSALHYTPMPCAKQRHGSHL